MQLSIQVCKENWKEEVKEDGINVQKIWEKSQRDSFFQYLWEKGTRK